MTTTYLMLHSSWPTVAPGTASPKPCAPRAPKCMPRPSLAMATAPISMPARSHFDAVPLPTFDSLPIPRSWLYAQEDVALPPGQYGWHPRLSERLGGYRLVSMTGSHEVLFTRPAALAEAIHLAGRD